MTEQIETIQSEESETVSSEPKATMRGNAFDLTSLGALASGVLMLFMCLSCNLGFYCLPALPIILGVVGLATARKAVNREQSQTMSWVGLAAGGLSILLMAAGFIFYIGLYILLILSWAGYS